MKTRTLTSIVVTFLITLLLISGCATTGKMKEPAKPESTLLIGRVKLVCEGFPREWHINGEHTKNLRVYFVDPITKELVKVKTKGSEGVFYLIDPAAGQYVLAGFEIIIKQGNWTFKNHHLIENTFISVTKNSVNNLGDILWYDSFSEQDKRGGGSSTFKKVGRHDFKFNYDEVESWFRNAFAENSWNGKNWVDVEYAQY